MECGVVIGSLQPEHAVACIEQIRSDVFDAIGKVKSGHGHETENLAENLEPRLEAYLGNLAKIGEAGKLGLKKQLSIAKKLWETSSDAAVFATLRGLGSIYKKIDAAKAFEMAKKVTVFKPLPEPVRARWLEKPKGGYRLIVAPGPMRRAQALMVRDALSMCGIDSEFDFSQRGKGEKALIDEISSDIEDGYKWWWCPDVKDCFGSIRPGHFGWLPIDRRVIMYVFYLPKCAEVKMGKVSLEEEKKIFHSLGKDISSIPSSVSSTLVLHTLTVHRVCRGLLQGSVLSPLLARSVIARVLSAAASDQDVSKRTYCDDLFLGASNKEVLLAGKQAVTKQFSSLPGGPIELHDAPITDVLGGNFLGYKLVPGKGHGPNYVHCKPGKKRIEKFKRELKRRLKARKADQDPFKVGDRYWKRWFGSQAGWTKVPHFSRNVSSLIAQSYVSDFLDGIPMGGYTHKPPLKDVNNPMSGG